MLLLSEAEVLELASFARVLEAITRAFIAAADGSGTINPVVIGRGLNPGETFSIKSGSAAAERIAGLKVGSYWPQNSVRGLRRHASSILLLDPDTGRLRAVIEASALNGLRTAAADAVAARALARPDSSTLTLFGAGHQALYEARALCAVRPIRQVLVVARSTARATPFLDQLSRELAMDVRLVDAERGCCEADVLVTVTPSRAPLFDSAWLRPGVHIASMGSDQQGKQELPPDLLRKARLFCDLPSQSTSIGEFQHVRSEVEAGTVRLTALGDVLAGRAEGRAGSDEITVFDSSGLALQDLFVAAALLDALPS